MRTRTAFPILLGLLTFACSEPRETSVTDPGPALRFAKPIATGPCAAKLGRDITSQMAELFAKPQLDSAKLLWGTVEAQCGSAIAQARESMLTYVQFTIANKAAIKPQTEGTWQANLIAHWSATFTFVGYTNADQPGSVPSDIFDSEGAVGVIPASMTGSLELAAANAALTMYQQNAVTGDTRGHLFVIYPLAANCLGATNLSKAGPCYEFGSFPAVAPAFDPLIKVGICQVHQATDSIHHHLDNPALAHLTGNVARVQELGGTYPTTCGDIVSVPAGSWNGGIRNIATRLAWHAKQTLTPKPLYAVHGGLGGLGGKLSPHQAVELLVFSANFEDDAIGQLPGQPETGTFTTPYLITPPGSIVVQSSLGQHASKLAVLTQGGGNCNNCGGLMLEGNLSTGSPGVFATSGVYDAEWISLQEGPTMKKATFVLRSSSGAQIAAVNYGTKSSVNTITYGSSNTVLANWVRYVPIHFRIRVDLDAKTTTLFIDGVQKATASFSATNFAKIAADFRGIDSGIMGWDDIEVRRIPGT